MTSEAKKRASDSSASTPSPKTSEPATASAAAPPTPPTPTAAPAPAPRIPYLVEGIYPTREIHLFSGPSGVGKTTFLFQTLEEWRLGQPVFGRNSIPTPFCYVACGRSGAYSEATMGRIGIDPSLVPSVSAFDNNVTTLEDAVGLALDRVSAAKLIVLDGVTKLIDGNPNYPNVVAKFFSQAATIAKKNDLTFLVVTSAAKTKEGERYLAPRQRVSGSSAWGEMAGTVVVIEEQKCDDPTDPRRKVYVMPLNDPAKNLHYKLDKVGRFVIAPDDAEASGTDFETLVFAAGEGSSVSADDLNSIFLTLFISPRTGYRLVADLIQQGRLKRVSNGVYFISRSQ